MDQKSLRLCAWAGPASLVCLFLGILPLMGFLPPLAPTMPLAELAAYYRTHANGIIVGSIFIMLSASLFFPFIAGLCALVRRMERETTPWTYALLGIVTFSLVPLFLSPVFFTAAAFRADASDELVRALSDIGFFLLVIPALPAVIWCFVTAFAILGDRAQPPVFPRWVGFLNLWIGVLSAPGCVIGLFKSGPFAWNGILAFWVPAGVFGLWTVVMVWAMLQATQRADTK